MRDTANHRPGQVLALAVLAAALLLLQACAGRYEVRHVTPADTTTTGFRYYLPRPYLLITNMALAGATPAGGGTPKPSAARSESGNPPADDRSEPPPPGSVITVQLVWLPDFSQQYSVQAKRGLTGTFQGKLDLTNGWMLVGVNEQYDTKTAETLKEVSGLLGTVFAAGGLGTRALTTFKAEPTSKPFLLLFTVDVDAKTLAPVKADCLNTLLGAALEGTQPSADEKKACP